MARGQFVQKHVLFEYSSARTYNAGQLVNYNNRIFISLTDNNKGNNPLLSGANWVEYAGISAWNRNRIYASNDFVSFGGVIYKSKTGNNQNRQPNIYPSYWDPIFATKAELTAEQQARINKDNELQIQIDEIASNLVGIKDKIVTGVILLMKDENGYYMRADGLGNHMLCYSENGYFAFPLDATITIGGIE